MRWLARFAIGAEKEDFTHSVPAATFRINTEVDEEADPIYRDTRKKFGIFTP